MFGDEWLHLIAFFDNVYFQKHHHHHHQLYNKQQVILGSFINIMRP
jgi:hypothetical protein